MMRNTGIYTLGLLFAAGLFLGAGAVNTASAQNVVPAPDAAPSPLAMAKLMLNDTYMKITYGSPRKRGRVIFGGLEPMGQVWRTGANDATEITFTKDVMFAGEHVNAGTYTLFTIPNENEWGVILNSGLGQWGDYGYDESQNVLMVMVTPSSTEDVYEAFTISFEEGSNENTTHLTLVWDQTKVEVPISTM